MSIDFVQTKLGFFKIDIDKEENFGIVTVYRRIIKNRINEVNIVLKRVD